MADTDDTQSGDTSTQSSETDDSTNTDQNSQGAKSLEDLERRLQEVSAEAKKYRQTNSKLKADLEAIEKKKLEEQGKYKEMYEKAKSDYESLNGKLKSTSKSVAFRREAIKQGCLPDLVEVLEKAVDLEQLELDDSFKPQSDQVEFMVKEMREKYGQHFFKKTPPKIDDGDPKKPSKEKVLTHEEWKKLPYAEKRKRISEIKAE